MDSEETLTQKADAPKKYAYFRVREYTASTFFKRELKAYDADGKEMALPVTVKNFYRHLEAAQAVTSLIERFFVGKTKAECEKLLGVEHGMVE